MENIEKEDILSLKKALKFIRQGSTMIDKVNDNIKNDTLTNLMLLLKKDIDSISNYLKKNSDNVDEAELSKLIKMLKTSLNKIEHCTEKITDRQLTLDFN